MTRAPRKFLVVADESDECRLALYYAARRAKHTNGRVTILAVLEPSNFEHWATVGEAMRREAREEAEALLHDLAQDVIDETGGPPEVVIREGEGPAVLRALIEEDPGLKVLILGASTGRGGAGPLVSALAKGTLFGARAVPVTVVPGSLTRDEIHGLA